MVTGQNSQIFNLIIAGTAAVGTIVANEGAIAEEKEVRIRVEQSAAGIASEAIQMPSISSCRVVRTVKL